MLGETPSGPVNPGLLKAIRGALQLPHNSSVSLPLTPQHSTELLSWLAQKQVLSAPFSDSHTMTLLLAARLYKVAARDIKLLNVQLMQYLASVSCRFVRAYCLNAGSSYALQFVHAFRIASPSAALLAFLFLAINHISASTQSACVSTLPDSIMDVSYE